MSDVSRKMWIQVRSGRATDWGLLLSLVGAIMIFYLLSPMFATTHNFVSLQGRIAALLIVSIGETFVVLMGSLDLSIGAIAALSGIIMGITVRNIGAFQGALLVVVLVAIAVGAVVGFTNGMLLTKLKIPSILATLGTWFACDGISYSISRGERFSFTQVYNILYGAYIPGLSLVFLLALLVWALSLVLAHRTLFGRYIYAIGGGENESRLLGIKVDRYKVLAFVLCGVLAAVSGVLLAAEAGAASLLAGSFMLDSIAAVFLAGTAVSGGVGGPRRTLVGVLLIAVLVNGMNVINVHPNYQTIVKGIVILYSIYVSIDRSRIHQIK
jgi:ribose transport system permease protein/putative xylitol transport system permease protein